MTKRIGWSVAAVVLWVAAARAEEATKPPAELTMDTVVISPTRTEKPIAETAPSISVITGEDLERKQVTTVADALREVPGLEVSESGSRGSLTSVFIRGSEADQVLVLVDNIRVNSTTLGSFDFSGLTPENIDRIEVLRGFGGTIYGSAAVGGVIQIFTRKGSGPPRGSVAVSGGNGGTDRELAEVSGSSGIVAFSGSAFHLHTDGFRPVNDDYSNTVLTGRLDIDPEPTTTARLSFRIGDSEFGNFFSNNFLAKPAPNARQQDQTDLVRAEWGQALESRFRYRLGFSYAREDEQFDDLPDAAKTSTTHSDFLSQTFAGDANATLGWWRDQGESTFGIDYENQAGNVDSLFSDPAFGDSRTKFDRDDRNFAGYTIQQLFLDERRLVLTGGVRVDQNQRFGRAVSPSSGASYLVSATGTRLRTTYAKGFKAPTLNQLFFPGFGNPDLEAERSWEVDAGFDQPLWDGRALVTATTFHRRIKNLIQGVPQASGLFLAENVGRATVEGVELELDLEVLPGVHAGGEYTFLDIDASINSRVRKPKHSGSVHVDAAADGIWQSRDRLSLDARLLLVGERPDFDPAAGFAARENPAYQRADLATAYSWPIASRFVKRLKVFGRIENLFNRRYQEVLGFGARPLNFLAGVGGEF